jgi:hypothetical protein
MRVALVVPLILALAGCSSATAPALNISGSWIGTAGPPECAQGLTEQIQLSQSGDSLSGTYSLQDCDGNMSAGPIDDAYVSGDSVVFDSGWDTFRGVYSNGEGIVGHLTDLNSDPSVTLNRTGN